MSPPGQQTPCLGKGQELLPLELLERLLAGWCRCCQVTAQGFTTKMSWDETEVCGLGWGCEG